MSPSKRRRKPETLNSDAKKQTIDSLKLYLKKEDREKICREHNISVTTYNRHLRTVDTLNPVFGAIVEAARVNKERQQATEQTLKALTS